MFPYSLVDVQLEIRSLLSLRDTKRSPADDPSRKAEKEHSLHSEASESKL